MERRESRKRFATASPPACGRPAAARGAASLWLVDAVAVHLSGFTTQSLAGDFGRTPEEVAQVSAQVIEAALAAALP